MPHATCRSRHTVTTPNPTQLWWHALHERERDVRKGVRTEDERKRELEKKKKEKEIAEREREREREII